jgi:hypothetical protein
MPRTFTRRGYGRPRTFLSRGPRTPGAPYASGVRRLLCLLAVVPALAGCSLLGGGGGGEAEDALGETADNLGEIRSGTLDLRLLVEPRDGDAFGLELNGPFELPEEEGALPELDLDYTQIAGGRRGTIGLVSTGDAAFTVVDGQAYELGDDETDELRAAARSLEGLARLPIDEWIDEPTLEDGGEVGGAETDLVSGDLDLVAAANDLIDLARGFGPPLPQLAGANADRVREAARDTSIRVWTGTDDRLLRRMLLEAELGDVPGPLGLLLGDLVPAKITFELGVTDPNRPVTVEAPRDPRPASERPD